MATDDDAPDPPPLGEDEDLLEEPEEEEGESLLVSISRRFGQVTRQVKNLSDAITRRGGPVPRRRPEPPLDATLRKLGEMVKAHEASGYTSLAKEDEFWDLVTALGRLGWSRRLKRKQAPRARTRGREIRLATKPIAVDAELAADEAAPATAGEATAEPTAAGTAAKPAQKKRKAAAPAEPAPEEETSSVDDLFPSEPEEAAPGKPAAGPPENKS